VVRDTFEELQANTTDFTVIGSRPCRFGSSAGARSSWVLRLSLSIRTVLNTAPHLTRWPSADAYRTRKMREHFANGRPGHVAKGWMSDHAGSGSAGL
jgi:hypothetical protein